MTLATSAVVAFSMTALIALVAVVLVAAISSDDEHVDRFDVWGEP